MKVYVVIYLKGDSANLCRVFADAENAFDFASKLANDNGIDYSAGLLWMNETSSIEIVERDVEKEAK